MKIILISIFILVYSNLFSQTENPIKDELLKELNTLKTSIQTLQSENSKLKSEISNLNIKLSNSQKSIDSLRALMQKNISVISQTTKELENKISATETDANQKIKEIDKSLSKTSLYGIIGVLSAIIVSILIYWLLNKRQKSDKTDIIDKLSQTKSSIEESLLKQFEKQIELMETQLELLLKQKSQSSAIQNDEPDHSLALKVASEINIIERNLSLMDTNVKGYKQLKKSVEKLKDNLNANGYEIIELLGKEYHPGLPVIIINSYPDENLEKDTEIISKILIPAVRYNDKIIQTAQIEVNIGV